MKLRKIKKSILFGLVATSSLQAVEPLAPVELVEPGAIPEVVKEVPLVKEKAWLGVMSTPVDEAMYGHLGIESGVLLKVVADKSPAAAAGFQVNDIITGINGQAIESQLDLRELVHKQNIGEELSIDVISNGEKQTLKAVLALKPTSDNVVEDIPDKEEGALGFDLEKQLNDALPEIEGIDKADLQKQIQAAINEQFGEGAGENGGIKKMVVKVKQFNGGDLGEGAAGDGLQLKIQKMLREMIPEGAAQREISLNRAVRVKDAEGIIEMKKNNGGGKEIVIKDINGEILYQGPYNNVQDKAAIPADLAHRIEAAGAHLEKGLKLNIEGLNPAQNVPKEAEAAE